MAVRSTMDLDDTAWRCKIMSPPDYAGFEDEWTTTPRNVREAVKPVIERHCLAADARGRKLPQKGQATVLCVPGSHNFEMTVLVRWVDGKVVSVEPLNIPPL